jgi:hypothetical protein
MFLPKRDEVTGDWGKLHNEELCNLYNSNDQVEENEMCRSCSTKGERNAYKILVGNPEGKRPLGRPSCR